VVALNLVVLNVVVLNVVVLNVVVLNLVVLNLVVLNLVVLNLVVFEIGSFELGSFELGGFEPKRFYFEKNSSSNHFNSFTSLPQAFSHQRKFTSRKISNKDLFSVIVSRLPQSLDD
jgi:hypothetical protein